jgi:hypothetical protein
LATSSVSGLLVTIRGDSELPTGKSPKGIDRKLLFGNDRGNAPPFDLPERASGGAT